MKSISVREMKASWAEVEAQVRDGEIIEVMNRGRPTVRLVPVGPRKVAAWGDLLASASEAKGRTAQEIVRADREGRW